MMPAPVKEINIEAGNAKFAVIRRDPYTLFVDLPAFIDRLKIKEILSVSHTESNGNITLCIFYR